MFTSTSSGEMLVEYGAGLADKLVAGEVDPGRVAIDRATGVSRQLRRSDEGSLGERQLEQLRLAGLAAEAEFGAAQDVEWAIDGSGSLYVVQSRPITAPVTIPAVAAANGRRISWSNANVNENFPRPISPLLYSIASAGYTHYFRNLAVACGVSPARVRAMEPGVSANHRRARRADVLQPDVDSFGAAPRAVRRRAHEELRRVRRRGRRRGRADCACTSRQGASDARGGSHRGERDDVARSRLGRRIERFERTVDDFAARSTSRLDSTRMSLVELRETLAELHRHSLPQMAGRFVGRRCGDGQLWRARAAAARRGDRRRRAHVAAQGHPERGERRAGVASVGSLAICAARSGA